MNPIGRRSLLRGSAIALGVAGLVPPLGSRARAATHPVHDHPSGVDPDELFRTGRFAAADAGYRHILRDDPDNAHAIGQRGYVALLSNRFDRAEYFLRRAVQLAPHDNAVRYRLADCFVRQDNLTAAVPLLRTTGRTALADQYASVSGRPYRVSGAQSARLPFRHLDPLPVVDAAVNGNPGPFFLDTGATLVLTRQMAEQAGIQAVASQQTDRGNGQLITIWFGVMDELRLGSVRLCNVPVVWNDVAMPTVPGAERQPVGAIGTTLLYHFIATMDYAGRALVLRRKSRGQQRAVRAHARRVGASTAPFWLAPDHFLYSWGRVNDHGPGLVGMDTGGPAIGVVLRDEDAALAGVVPDYSQPRRFFGVTVHPCVVSEAGLGGMVRHQVPGIVGPVPSPAGSLGFTSLANFTHEFFRPLAVTFDFMDMTLYLAAPHDE